jgi:GT2 family glycosyltransferase
MPARVDISVAIATRGRPAALARLLEALAATETRPAEVVVVDQSADDETGRVAREHCGTPLELRYALDRRTGLGAAQNLAFSLARCPIVAVTDDDCVPTEQWLPTIAERFATQPDVGALTGPVFPLDDPDPALVPVSSRTSTEPRSFAGKHVPWQVGSGNNFAVRREWLDAVAGNDERLGPGAPGRGGVDMDLFYRLLRAGARIEYDPRCVVRHARTTRRERLGRRVPYGFGTGAGIGIWLREGDAFAAWVLARWLAHRLRRGGRGVLTGDWLLAREEALVLGGTARGLWFGLRQDAERLSSYATSDSEAS